MKLLLLFFLPFLDFLDTAECRPEQTLIGHKISDSREQDNEMHMSMLLKERSFPEEHVPSKEHSADTPRMSHNLPSSTTVGEEHEGNSRKLSDVSREVSSHNLAFHQHSPKTQEEQFSQEVPHHIQSHSLAEHNSIEREANNKHNTGSILQSYLEAHKEAGVEQHKEMHGEEVHQKEEHEPDVHSKEQPEEQLHHKEHHGEEGLVHRFEQLRDEDFGQLKEQHRENVHHTGQHGQEDLEHHKERHGPEGLEHQKEEHREEAHHNGEHGERGSEYHIEQHSEEVHHKEDHVNEGLENHKERNREEAHHGDNGLEHRKSHPGNENMNIRHIDSRLVSQENHLYNGKDISSEPGSSNVKSSQIHTVYSGEQSARNYTRDEKHHKISLPVEGHDHQTERHQDSSYSTPETHNQNNLLNKHPENDVLNFNQRSPVLSVKDTEHHTNSASGRESDNVDVSTRKITVTHNAVETKEQSAENHLLKHDHNETSKEISGKPLTTSQKVISANVFSEDMAQEICGQSWHFFAGNPCIVRCDGEAWGLFVRMGGQVKCRRHTGLSPESIGRCNHGFCV